jgi:hypothetical protein
MGKALQMACLAIAALAANFAHQFVPKMGSQTVFEAVWTSLFGA